MPIAEDKLVQRIANALAFQGRRGLALGIGDDAALLVPARGCETILTCDWFLEGSHFLRDRHPPDSIGWKCLARAVSDVAAMGGEPKYFLLSIALPKTHTGSWLDGFLDGLRRASRRLRCRLAGGDTTKSHQILISVTVFGEVQKRRVVLRSGARAGDLIFVSGRLGEAELGLRSLRGNRTAGRRPDSVCVRKHLYPEPRLVLGRWLAQNRIATAMLDLSDGLSIDLSRLCTASQVGAQIEIGRLPKIEIPRERTLRSFDFVDLALHGGDDYELLFTVRPRQARRVPRVLAGLPLTCIGEVTRGKRLVLRSPQGRTEILSARGWDPFAK